MAVVKASYTKSKVGAKASLQYILFRPGRKGEEVERQLFGHDGTLTLQQGNRLSDEAGKGTTFFRVVISPDPEKEDIYKDLNMWEITQLSVLKLEERLKQEIHFIATEHNDHTPNRHVHAIMLVQGKLGVEDLTFLREAATEIVLMQRLERDMVVAYEQGRGAVPERPFARTPQPQAQLLYEPENRSAGANRLRRYSPAKVCHLCGEPAGKNASRCYNCGARLEISVDLGDNGISDGWEL